MPTEAWKSESVDSIKNKLSFIVNTFVLPYLEEDARKNALNSLGIQTSALSSSGVVRFRYTHNGSTPITTESEMNTFFSDRVPDSNKGVTPTIYEGNNPVSSKYAFEYVGFINVQEDADYIFGLNSDDVADVYVDRRRVAYWYSDANHAYKSPETTPGGTFNITTKLAPGQYPIRVRYVRNSNSGTPQLNLLWKKLTDSAFSAVPCDALFHDPMVMSTETRNLDVAFDENDLITNVLDYDKFKLYFGIPTQEMTNSMGTNLNRIMLSRNNEAYTGYNVASSIIPSLDPTEPNRLNGDINYKKFMNTVRTVGNGNKLQRLIDFVRSIRLLYNVMDDDILENMKAGNAVSVSGYDIDENTNRTIMYGSNEIQSQFPELLTMLNKFTRVEYFLFRRILLLLDLVIHSHISMLLFETVFTNAVFANNKTKTSEMVIFFVSRLKKLNANFGVMFESRPGEDANSLVSNLYDNVREFNERSEQINELDRQVKESKNSLKSKNNLLKSQKQLYESGNKWALFAFIVTIVVIVTLASYAVMVRVNPSLKWVGASSVALFSSLLALAFYFIKTKRMESFVGGGIYQEQVLSDILTTGDAIDTIRSAYYVDTLKEMDIYIQNSINMALILQNNNAYKYINYNLQKETNYYTGTKMQMDNATATVGAAERMYNLNTRNNLSKMNTFIALIIILTFGVIGYVLADGYTTIQYIILATVSILLLIVAILYILDTQSKVRTNGSKIYWGQPTESIQKIK